ncbi:MAG: response regulator transcription factor [Polyangiaceae bacterium]|nr:response regulator transcription factor [Polyangiaceae bacterium]
MTEELVLVVEDDPTMRLGLQKALRSAGYRVEVARDGTEGLARALAAPRPDLVLLDVMLPGRNGYEVLEEIRLVDPELIVLMLTAKGEERDKVRGLGLGADDYVTKPFGVAELLARVAAALRRRRLQDRETETVTIGAVTVDFGAHRMRRGDVELECTALELRLLRFLLRHEGSLVSRQRILDGVWGADYFGTDRTVDNFVNRLRAKLEDDPQAPRLLVTVRGAGYRFSRRPEG